LQGLIQELSYFKNFEEDIVLDKLSLADYFNAMSIILIKESDGPNLIPEISYGRQDTKNEKEAGSPSQIPTSENFKSNLLAKGFDDEEIVALAYV
jgi:hypothetical protein